MRRELQKLVKPKKSSWSLLPKRFGLRKKSHEPSSGQSKDSKVNAKVAVAPDQSKSTLDQGKEQNHENGDVAAH